MALQPRTYVYKLTSDRGGAPAAPHVKGQPDLLTLSICKPAIRRTARPGDRVVGLTSRKLAATEDYPLNSVIYAAVISGAVDAREYYAPRSRFRDRPDCIYTFHRVNGTLAHTGRTALHADPAYWSRDLGSYPYYKNGRTLLSDDFRYFGVQAMSIPPQLCALTQLAEELGQGHRVLHSSVVELQLDKLFKLLWKRFTRYTPHCVQEESYGHAPLQHGSKRRFDAARR